MTGDLSLPPPHRHRVLVIGRSKGVLADTLALLRGQGYTADATNEFDRVLDSFDMAALDVVVLGGMVPPETRQRLHEQITSRNPDVLFVQGFAGIPGLIAAQVEAAVGTPGSDADVEYEAASRSIRLRLDRPREVSVVAWWGTAFVPPEPKSTSMNVLDAELPAGRHTIALPDAVPAQASFVTVSVGSSAWAFIVAALPPGATMAQFGDRPPPPPLNFVDFISTVVMLVSCRPQLACFFLCRTDPTGQCGSPSCVRGFFISRHHPFPGITLR